MALRIGGGKPPKKEEELESQAPMEEVPVEEALPVEEPLPEEPLPTEEEPMPTEGGLVDPVVAGYKTPDMGPFMCANCMHFMEGGTCEILASPVEEMGLCNLFTPMPMPEGEEMPLPEEAGMPQEAPMDAPPVEEPPPQV